MSADTPQHEFDASIEALFDSLFSVPDQPDRAPCPNCKAEVAVPPDGGITICENCTTKLVRNRPLSFQHYSVITRYAPTDQRDYWIQRAAAEGLTPERLGAEIKYTARQYVYGSRPTKGRRSKQEIDAIKAAIYNALLEDRPMTVRQVFYRLVANGVVEKREQEYKGTVGRLLTLMRLSGDVPFSWIADNTRWMRKPNTYSSLENMLQRTVEAYRRAVWDNQDVYVEMWTEKDAIAGIMSEETVKWDVPLMVVRGFSSLTFLHSAAETIAEKGKPAYIYYFGDHDPTGVVIPQNVERRIREFAPYADVTFECVAVTPEQIESMKLPTRATKKTDSRSKNFVGESVDVDALPPKVLRQLVSDCITQHVDQRAYDVLKEAEESERSALTSLIANRTS